MLVGNGRDGGNEERTWKGAGKMGLGMGEKEREEEELGEVLRRLYALVPSPRSGKGEVDEEGRGMDPPEHLQVHLLHLSGKGVILPHVDNLESSGDVIVGVSLGSERVLRFNPPEEERARGMKSCEVLLEKGSVYVQT